jgi:hypothetical protein
MNISDHFDHPEKRQNKEHFNHLIEIATTDYKIQDTENTMLHRIGKEMGFTDPEIDNLIESGKKPEFNPPFELAKRFEQFYDIVKIILSDGEANLKEIGLASRVALIYGFNNNEIPTLLDLLINGIKNGIDEEDLFKIFRSGRIII